MKRAAKSNLIVSSRGQITLPADLRKKIGIKDGGVVTIEEHNGELVLRPAAVLEIDVYSDEEIAQWEREDNFSDKEKAAIRKKLQKSA